MPPIVGRWSAAGNRRPRLAGPKKLYLFEGLGHESFLSRRPAEWRAQVGAFLAAIN